jgi:hypothetical protein
MLPKRVLCASNKKVFRAALEQPEKTPAADRPALGAKDAVAQRDRGRSRIASPNSRQSRRRSPATSSHRQGREHAMEAQAFLTFVGIDVAKQRWDVHLLPTGQKLACSADTAGLQQLLAALALIGITIWLVNTAKNKKAWMYTFYPAIFMFVMSVWALINMFITNTTDAKSGAWVGIPGGANAIVPITCVIYVVLAVWMAVETIIAFNKSHKGGGAGKLAAEAAK